MRRSQPQHFELVEPWLAELDQLTRRRADDMSDIDAHLARFNDALRDWQAMTGDAPEAYRARFSARIGEMLASPWPKSAVRTRKLAYAKEWLTRSRR